MKYSALLLLAFGFLTGIVEIETNRAAGAESLLAFVEEPRIPQIETATPRALPTRDRLGQHYLMLVNTAVAAQLDAQKVAQFDRSPYDGVAVSFADAYDTSPVRSVTSMEAQIAGWKHSTTQDIWPWVSLNRMVGANDTEGNEYSKAPYFERFQELDLDDKAGAQKDFLENWGNALRTAKDTGVPGIVCDLEFYIIIKRTI